MQDFQANDIAVILAGCENEENSRKMVDRIGLTMPYAYGLDPKETSKALGCYYDPEDGYVHATGFLIDPENKITVAAYSSGMVGRIRAENALAIIRYLQTEDAAHLPET